RGLAWNISKRVGGLWLFFLGPILSIPLIMLPWIAGDKRIRFLLVVCAVMAVGLLLEVWTTPHYAAPMTGVILAILLQAMRHLRVWRWRGKPAGLLLTRAIPVTCGLLLALWTATSLLPETSALHPLPLRAWCCAGEGLMPRASILAELN